MQVDDLITNVRAELGKLPTTNIVDIEDTDIVREAGHILLRIAHRITKKTYRSITTTANQRGYAVDTNTLRVQDVLPSGITVNDLMTLGDPIRGESSLDNEDYIFPSLWAIKMMRKVRGLARVQWEYHPIERKLKIDPIPTNTGDIYWYISIEKSDWTLANVPEDFTELVVTGTVWKCLEIIALRRSSEGGILREGGRVEYPASTLKQFSDAKKEEFNTMLNAKARLYSL